MARALGELRVLHPDENLIVVSHGGAIAHLIARLLGTRPAFGHQYISKVQDGKLVWMKKKAQ